MIIIGGDAPRLQRAFRNLIDNSIKYSEGQGAIRILIDQNDLEVIIKISDEGMGIPAEELPFIFDPFYRGTHTITKEGSGLGLAEVKTIIAAHGGRITVESELGKGSVFMIYLPKNQQ
nr:ATP-binding protein [Desulfobacterales bacterium]